jgi:hypothetical protein
MRYTVWLAGRLLGTTALDLHSYGAARAGYLEPSEAFADVWDEIGPVFREMRDVTHALVHDAQLRAEMRPDPSLSRDEVARRVHQVVVAHPLTPRFSEADARARSLPLAVRDADGQVIPCTRVIVQELTAPDFIPPGAIQQSIADDAKDGDALSWPMYLVLIIESPYLAAMTAVELSDPRST